MVKVMESDMLSLREIYKHDPVKRLEVSHDWMDYSNAIWKQKITREMMDVDMSDNAFKSFNKNTKEVFIVIREVSKRVEEMLGKESNSKIVNER